MFKLTKEYKHPWADDFVYAAVTRLTRFASTVLARRASVPENRATFKVGYVPCACFERSLTCVASGRC